MTLFPSNRIASNQLLDQLPRSQKKRVMSMGETVDLVFGDTLCLSEQRYSRVVFPLSGLISLVAEVDKHPPLEMGMIGNEGMLGATLLLDMKTAPLQAIVQGDGTAIAISARNLMVALEENSAFRVILARYLYVLIRQLSKTAVCTHYHDLDTRLVRWLLMTHDRVHADHFYLTHQFLADMLGVQRSAVTIAASLLQKQNIIRYSRGEITILDRSRLESRSCGCYEAIVRDYQKVRLH